MSLIYPRTFPPAGSGVNREQVAFVTSAVAVPAPAPPGEDPPGEVPEGRAGAQCRTRGSERATRDIRATPMEQEEVSQSLPCPRSGHGSDVSATTSASPPGGTEGTGRAE